MPSPDIAALRTLALVGPATAGKTSLVDALLWKAGAIGAPGSLERGTTVSDHDPLERRALHSLNSSLVHFCHGVVHTHLIDTPGAPEFLGQSLPALEAVETAAVVISATAGIEPMARRMMDWAAQRGRDRLLIVNKIDAQGVNLATPNVLEPIVTMEIAAPEAHIGDITGDLAARRGQVNGTQSASGQGALTVVGQAPLSELASYQARLNALTGGQASYRLAFSHYESVPPAVQSQLVAQYRVRDDP